MYNKRFYEKLRNLQIWNLSDFKGGRVNEASHFIKIDKKQTILKCKNHSVCKYCS